MNDSAFSENNKNKTSFLSTRICGGTLKKNFVFQILFGLGLNANKLWGFYQTSQWNKIIETVITGFFIACVIVLLLCVWTYIRELRANAKNH